MPELPEVEITVRDLKRKVLKRTFLDVWTDTPKFIQKPSSFKKFKSQIIGKKILDIFRRGKNIIFHLSDNFFLLIHQKLTGHLLYGKWERKRGKWISQEELLRDKMNTFIHLMFFLDNSKQIALSDLRKFAKVKLFYSREEFENSKEYKEVGLDPLSPEFTLSRFREIIKRNRPIKIILTDQKLIAGIGNIYSSEILFESMIHPLKKGVDLSDKEVEVLYENIEKVLKKGLKLGGASISDYRKPDGSRGLFDQYRKVYQKEGNPCPRCGTLIKKITIGGRSAYFCPHCQKL